ncbi:MAG: hypothetical protein AB9917_02120 [Negativicutes bacterium]
MAEMTASEAVAILTDEIIFLVGSIAGKEYKLKGMEISVAHKIASLIERQTAEIERLKSKDNQHCEFCQFSQQKDISLLIAEIAKKDRMLERAAEVIADKCTFICTANVKPQGYCKKCKLAWLEKEAEVPG